MAAAPWQLAQADGGGGTVPPFVWHEAQPTAPCFACVSAWLWQLAHTTKVSVAEAC